MFQIFGSGLKQQIVSKTDGAPALMNLPGNWWTDMLIKFVQDKYKVEWTTGEMCLVL